MSKSLKTLLATAALALLGNAGPLATGASAAAEGSKVILLTVTDECSYCALHKRAFLEEAAKHGLDVEVKINNFDPAEQASQVDQALGQRPDAIVLWPADANAIVPSLRKIKMAGVPLVVTNSLPDQKYSDFWDAFTGPDDIGNGASAAEALIEGFNERGLTEGEIFVLVGPRRTLPGQARRDFSAPAALPRPQGPSGHRRDRDRHLRAPAC
jgi:ribose transport system substrate-binding protein